MRNYDNYKLSLSKKENDIIEYINKNKNHNRTLDEVFNDDNIEFASISIGKGKDDNDIKNSVIKVAGIDKLLIDERTVIGNIPTNLEDRKYIAVNDYDVSAVQKILNESGVSYDGPYESAEDAFILDTSVDAINKGCAKNNTTLGWVDRAYLINSQRSEFIDYPDEYIMKTDFYNVTETAVRELSNNGTIGAVEKRVEIDKTETSIF